MNARTIDIDGTSFYLKLIFETFNIIMENLEEEHKGTKGHEAIFHTRMEDVYIPALNLMLCFIHWILNEVEANV